MGEANLYDAHGKVVGKTNLPKELFGTKINEPLLAQAIRIYLSNQRKARAKTKTRGQVKATTAKWYRQKGTGRARHGAKSAPIFVGGGVAHGPTGQQNWGRSLPGQMRRQALASALASKLKEGEIIFLEDLAKIGGKTKNLAMFLQAFSGDKKKKLDFLLVLLKADKEIKRAAYNLSNLRVREVKNLNAYDVLKGGKILFTKEAMGFLKNL